MLNHVELSNGDGDEFKTAPEFEVGTILIERDTDIYIRVDCVDEDGDPANLVCLKTGALETSVLAKFRALRPGEVVKLSKEL